MHGGLVLQLIGCFQYLQVVMILLSHRMVHMGPVLWGLESGLTSRSEGIRKLVR